MVHSCTLFVSLDACTYYITARLYLNRNLLCQPGLTSGIAAAGDFPVHQPQRVDVGTFKGVKVAHVDTLI